jgi:hypothetical protein
MVRPPLYRGCQSDCEPKRSDHQALRSSFVTCFTDFGCTPRDALDSTCAMRDPGVHDSGRTTRASDVLAVPAALLASPSGCVGATGTASTSTIIDGEGRIGGTSDQPSSDDHVGEAGLPASDRQTHPIDQLSVNLVAGALLPLRRPRRSKLALRHGRKVCCLDRQQHMGSCSSPRWLQRRHRQIDF